MLYPFVFKCILFRKMLPTFFDALQKQKAPENRGFTSKKTVNLVEDLAELSHVNAERLKVFCHWLMANTQSS